VTCSTVPAVTPSEDGLWTGARQTGAQMATEVSNSTTVMVESRWRRNINPWTRRRTYRFSMAATTMKKAKTLRMLDFFMSTLFSPQMTGSTRSPTKRTSGTSCRLLLPPMGYPGR